MKKTFFFSLVFIGVLTGCTSIPTISESSPGVYNLQAINSEMQTGNEIKKLLIQQAMSFCNKKGGHFTLVSSRAQNLIPNYQKANAEIDFMCSFNFDENRDFIVSQNEVNAYRSSYQNCLEKVISKIYYKTNDQDEIALLAFRMCIPELKKWKYAEGYADNKKQKQVEDDLKNIIDNPTYGYEALLTYQRKALLTSKIL